MKALRLVIDDFECFYGGDGGKVLLEFTNKSFLPRVVSIDIFPKPPEPFPKRGDYFLLWDDGREEIMSSDNNRDVRSVPPPFRGYRPDRRPPK